MRHSETLYCGLTSYIDICNTTKQLTGMKSTIEQYGRDLDFLECRLRPLDIDDFIRVKSAVLSPPEGSSHPGDTRRMIDPSAPNAPRMLQSAMPNMGRKSQFYRTSLSRATANFAQMGGVLHCKGFDQGLWAPKLRYMARRWDIPTPARWDPAPLGPCSQILVNYLSESDPRA